ncbi:MAG: HAD-IA family hydrolase, partial [Pseudomonadota bacterium]
PHHFLQETHTLADLDTLVLQTQGLRNLIRRLPGRKVVFTNAPMRYALRVLKLLGIHDMFETVFSVESTRFHPKPSVRGFRQLLHSIKAKPGDCVMLEDNLPALMTAKRMGMRTVYVSKKLRKPPFVDARINQILKLTRTTI